MVVVGVGAGVAVAVGNVYGAENPQAWTSRIRPDQTRDSDCLEIAECILGNEDLDDPEALKAMQACQCYACRLLNLNSPGTYTYWEAYFISVGLTWHSTSEGSDLKSYGIVNRRKRSAINHIQSTDMLEVWA